MQYLIQVFALPLLATLAAGLAVGWVTSDKEDKGPSGWAALVLTLFALMAVASGLKWVPGRPGLWLDTAVLFTGAYLAGCIVGAFARVFTDKGEAPVAAVAGTAQALVSSTAAASPAAAGAARPSGITGPRGGRPDELELISGIGPQNEAKLHALGIYHFEQIAGWTAEEARWIGEHLAFPGRIEREDWIGQARVLAAGGSTPHAEKVRRGDIASTPD